MSGTESIDVFLVGTEATMDLSADGSVELVEVLIPVPYGTPGNDGEDGDDGEDGEDGKTILYGTAAPTSQGVDGDFYIRTSTWFIYGPKAGGVWPAGTSLVGPAGIDGIDGTDGVNGTNGNTVLYGTAAPTTQGVNGDFYIRTSTNFIYGPKAGGVWPAGVSMTGPAGADGSDGTNGTDGFIVLDVGETVPPTTPAGTLIFRRST